jgi:hypothetical protein
LKTAWPNIFVLIFLLAVTTVAAADQIRVTATLDDSTHTVTGRLSTIVSDLSPELRQLHFRLYPNRFCDSTDTTGTGCGLVVDSLFINGANRISEATVAGTDLALPILYEDLTDRELAIESYFTLKLPHDRERFGYRENHYALEAWLPVPAPRDDTGWLVIDYSNPTVEPVGDPVDFDVSLTVPSRYAVIAPGLLDSTVVDSLTTYRLTIRDAAHVPIVVATGYESDTKTTGSIAHTVYYKPEAAYAVDSIQAWIGYTLEYMNAHVYPFPKDELIVVVGALAAGGGLEHPQMIWLNKLFPVSPLYSPRMVVVHEVIHEWFFYLVNSNQASEPWLDESVTEYFTLKVLKAMSSGSGHLLNYFGMSASYDLQHRMASDRLFAYHRIDVPAADIAERDLFPIVYAKGAQVMATLTGQMAGTEDQFWHTWVERNLYRRPDAAMFYELAESFTRGSQPDRAKALLTVLNRPDYRVEEIISKQNESGIDTPADSNAVYKNTVRLAVSNAISFTVDLTMELGTGKVTVTRETEQKLVGVIIDPNNSIVIDDNYFNNSLFPESVNSADQRIMSVLTFLVESIYSILWGI